MSADAVGGVWTYALDLAEAFAERGVRTTLALFGPVSASVWAQAKARPGLRVIVTGAPLDWLAASPVELQRAGDVFADLCAELKPDIAHLNAPSLATRRLQAPSVGVCHSCLETWWRAVRSGPAPDDFAWRTDFLRAGMRNCDVLLAPSAAFADATADAHGGPRPWVARNGRRRAAAPAATRAGGFVFVAGRLWDEGKNVATLDAAAALTAVEGVAAGPLQGPQGQCVRLAHVRPLGLLPPDEIAAWLARRPIFASCALYEPFGLAALEAAQAGCPLVLSDIPTHRELWRDAAWFFDPRDPNALAALLRRLAADTDAATELGDRARARSQDYTVDAMAEATLRAYATVAPAFSDLLRRAA
jgi:glycosyltransferase involved in cell wall biosynthesis